jgi:hypothetical protein
MSQKKGLSTSRHAQAATKAPLLAPEEIEDAVKHAVIWLSDWKSLLDDPNEEAHLIDLALMLVSDDPSLHGSGQEQLWRTELRETLIGRALRGSRAAHEALCCAGTVLVNRDKPLPTWLARYVIFVATESKPSRRGRPRSSSRDTRDTAIAWVADSVARAFGLSPTRNVATEAESACSIVTAAAHRLGMEMSEATANAAWGRMGSQVDDVRKAGPGLLGLTQQWERVLRRQTGDLGS